MGYKVDIAKKKIEEVNTLFFDLDGTLIDTEPLYFRFWREASKFYGYELSKDEALSMRSRDKDSAIKFLSDVSNGLLDYYQVKEKRIELMSEYLKDHPIELKEYALDILNKYINKDLYIVTANTVEKTYRILDMVDIRKYFKGVISAKDVKRGKPYPDVFIKACEVVNKKPNEVVVFEDSPNGLLASYSAKCFTLMVEDMSPYSLEIDHIDAAISSFKELL